MLMFVFGVFCGSVSFLCGVIIQDTITKSHWYNRRKRIDKLICKEEMKYHHIWSNDFYKIQNLGDYLSDLKENNFEFYKMLIDVITSNEVGFTDVYEILQFLTSGEGNTSFIPWIYYLWNNRKIMFLSSCQKLFLIGMPYVTFVTYFNKLIFWGVDGLYDFINYAQTTNINSDFIDFLKNKSFRYNSYKDFHFVIEYLRKEYLKSMTT